MKAVSIPATAAWAAVLLCAPLAHAQPAKPNLVFILMDNLGYGEVGVYGGGITRGAPSIGHGSGPGPAASTRSTW